jgi:RecA-family ATPase
MIPQGFPIILYGDGGTAKSLLAASLLLDISRGAESWLGHGIRQHGATIYLDFELDLLEQSRRAYQLAEGIGLDKPPEGFYYLSGADYPPGAVLDRTLQLAREMGAVLVVFDSLGFALEGYMEASRDVLRFIRKHVLPFKVTGVTLLIVDHQSKLQSGEGYHQKSPFGSVYKSNVCRSVIQVGVEDQREG